MEIPIHSVYITNMAKTPKRPRDVNQLAKLMVDEATGDKPTSEVAAKPNRKNIGGLKGGKARAKALAPENRIDIARTAAMARWKKSAD